MRQNVKRGNVTSASSLIRDRLIPAVAVVANSLHQGVVPVEPEGRLTGEAGLGLVVHKRPSAADFVPRGKTCVLNGAIVRGNVKALANSRLLVRRRIVDGEKATGLR